MIPLTRLIMWSSVLLAFVAVGIVVDDYTRSNQGGDNVVLPPAIQQTLDQALQQILDQTQRAVLQILDQGQQQPAAPQPTTAKLPAPPTPQIEETADERTLRELIHLAKPIWPLANFPVCPSISILDSVMDHVVSQNSKGLFALYNQCFDAYPNEKIEALGFARTASEGGEPVVQVQIVSGYDRGAIGYTYGRWILH